MVTLFELSGETRWPGRPGQAFDEWDGRDRSWIRVSPDNSGVSDISTISGPGQGTNSAMYQNQFGPVLFFVFFLHIFVGLTNFF